MRHILLIVVTTVFLAGCERGVQHDILVAPTSAALECARRTAVEHGYQPSKDAAEDGTPAFYRNLFGRNGDPPQEGSPKDWSIHDHLTIRAAGDRLRIAAVGGTIEGKQRPPSPPTLEHVQKIVAQIAAQCGKP